MNWFRTLRVRRWAAWFAVLGLLFQSGLTAWHTTAMVGAHASHADHAMIMCHADEANGTQADKANPAGKSQPTRGAFSCPCCLGMVSAAIEAGDAGKLKLTSLTSGQLLLRPSGEIVGGRHRLAPDSRGPPLA